MNLRAKIQKAVDGLPEEGAVTLPVGTLRRWLEEGSGGPAETGRQGGEQAIADLSVADLAGALGRSPSTIRGWLPEIEGAYKLHGEWRISREDWRRYLDSLADDGEDGPPQVRSKANADLDAWREERAS